MTPGPTVEQVAEKTNRNIRKLASLAAGKRQGVPEAADREIYRRSVISRLCYTKNV